MSWTLRASTSRSKPGSKIDDHTEGDCSLDCDPLFSPITIRTCYEVSSISREGIETAAKKDSLLGTGLPAGCDLLLFCLQLPQAPARGQGVSPLPAHGRHDL